MAGLAYSQTVPLSFSEEDQRNIQIQLNQQEEYCNKLQQALEGEVERNMALESDMNDLKARLETIEAAA